MQISEPAEYGILGLLQWRPMHGYEMFQQFERGALGQIVHLEMSQLYAFLKKLNHLAYIESRMETQDTRPPRKIFHLTDAGRSVFSHWLLQPVEKPRDIRILFLLKLYFIRRILPERFSTLVTQQIESCQQFLTQLENRQRETIILTTQALAIDDAAFMNQIVLTSRIYQTRSLVQWLQTLRSNAST